MEIEIYFGLKQNVQSLEKIRKPPNNEVSIVTIQGRVGGVDA